MINLSLRIKGLGGDMKNNKGYIAGAKRRLEKARKMLPDGFVLVRDLAEENFLNPHQILKWVRELTIDKIIANGYSAIIPNDYLLKLISQSVERKNRPEPRSGVKAEKYINENGEIINFAEWMRNLDTPTSYVVNYNYDSH